MPLDITLCNEQQCEFHGQLQKIVCFFGVSTHFDVHLDTHELQLLFQRNGKGTLIFFQPLFNLCENVDLLPKRNLWSCWVYTCCPGKSAISDWELPSYRSFLNSFCELQFWHLFFKRSHKMYLDKCLFFLCVAILAFVFQNV